MKVTPGGIVFPDTNKPDPKKRMAGPLEITWKDTHDEVGALFSKLLNVSCIRGAAICEGTQAQNAARKRLVLHVAHELLGPDWDYEELC
jgi:hypothetical protein